MTNDHTQQVGTEGQKNILVFFVNRTDMFKNHMKVKITVKNKSLVGILTLKNRPLPGFEPINIRFVMSKNSPMIKTKLYKF